MSKSIVKNVGAFGISLPRPYRGFIRGGGAIIINDTPANVLANFGGAAAIAGCVSVEDALNANPNDFAGGVEDSQIDTVVGAQVGDVIRISGKLRLPGDSPDKVIIKTIPSSVGTPTMAVAVGASIKNLGDTLLMETLPDGSYAVDVTDASTEDVVVHIVAAGDTSVVLSLVFV